MRLKPVHIVEFGGSAEPYQMRAGPARAFGKVGDGGLALEHAMVIEEIAKADAAGLARDAPAKHPIQKGMRILPVSSRRLKPLTSVRPTLF